MEDVREEAFTQVMTTAKGKTVRADFRVLRRDDGARTLVWEQLVEGTPFARVLSAAETELLLAPAASAAAGAGGGAEARGATTVTIELRQTLSGGNPRSRVMGVMIPRLGGMMVRRAAAATVEEALDGLERISG